MAFGRMAAKLKASLLFYRSVKAWSSNVPAQFDYNTNYLAIVARFNIFILLKTIRQCPQKALTTNNARQHRAK